MSRFRSGSAQLNSSTVAASSTIGNATQGELCRIEFPYPKPVIAQVAVRVAARDNYLTDPVDVHFLVDSGSMGLMPLGSAGLTFEFGVGATSRFVMSDLRPGSYALPPSAFLKVSYFAHRGGSANPWDTPVEVSATLFEGAYPTPTRPVYTVGVLANPDAYFAVPAGARWFDFWAAGSAPFAMDATSPILVCGAPSNTFPTLTARKNYQAGSVFPHGGPYELMGQIDNQNLPVYIEDTAAVGAFRLFSRFFLEF